VFTPEQEVKNSHPIKESKIIKGYALTEQEEKEKKSRYSFIDM